jgi:hypothetical protein
MNERYFCERLFWLQNTNSLLHVKFMHGCGWFAEEEDPSCGTWHYTFSDRTYTALMMRYGHLNPELLLQEEL